MIQKGKMRNTKLHCHGAIPQTNILDSMANNHVMPWVIPRISMANNRVILWVIPRISMANNRVILGVYHVLAWPITV